MNKTFTVHFNVYPDFQKIRSRKVKAVDKEEAIAIVSQQVPGSFYHYVKKIAQKQGELSTTRKKNISQEIREIKAELGKNAIKNHMNKEAKTYDILEFIEESLENRASKKEIVEALAETFKLRDLKEAWDSEEIEGWTLAEKILEDAMELL